MRSHTWPTRRPHQALQPTKLPNRRQTSTVVCSPLTFTVQSPSRHQVHGMPWLSIWFKKLADASPMPPRTAEKQHFCFSGCPWPSSRGMRSPSKTRWSPRETSLQPLNCSVFHAYRLCAGGLKKIIIIISVRDAPRLSLSRTLSCLRGEYLEPVSLQVLTLADM